MSDRRLGWKYRSPMWWLLFEVGIRRDVLFEWDEPTHVRWSFMFGFVAFDYCHRIRQPRPSLPTPEDNQEAAKNG